jgi:uncharacterized OB-fold protein
MLEELKTKYIGTPLEIMKDDDEGMVVYTPRTAVHRHTYGKLSPFFRALKKGKLMATRCVNPKCEEKRMWLPPRADCPDCNQPMEWVEIPNPVIGTIHTYAKLVYPGAGIELEAPYYQIDVEIPGCCTIFKGYLTRGTAKIGMKVKAGFNTKKPSNTILDIYWEPVK